MLKSASYDYIILGAGCAGLSLLLRLLKHPVLRERKILLVDQSPKTANDRTWCYWESDEGFFEPVVCKSWTKIQVRDEAGGDPVSIAPYRYKMIRGIDFYRYCFAEIARHPNVDVVFGTVQAAEKNGEGVRLVIDGREYLAGTAGTQLFHSFFDREQLPPAQMVLLQHFKGRIIQTPTPVFDEHTAMIMDFRVTQEGGTRFGYVLPLSADVALVEYTLFTRELLEKEAYDAALDHYIRDILHIDRYLVKEEEFGVIPMTDVVTQPGPMGWPIGTAGGQTKASSGYTFQFIQKQSAAIVGQLGAGLPLEKLPPTPRRFRFYDRTLLHILYNNTYPGKDIFTRLFRKNDATSVFRFLDNETKPLEEWKIIFSLPPLPFLKAVLAGNR